MMAVTGTWPFKKSEFGGASTKRVDFAFDMSYRQARGAGCLLDSREAVTGSG